jgi:hypothetical protein
VFIAHHLLNSFAPSIHSQFNNLELAFISFHSFVAINFCQERPVHFIKTHHKYPVAHHINTSVLKSVAISFLESYHFGKIAHEQTLADTHITVQ